MTEAVIVSTARTALTKSFRGSFNDTEAPVLGGHVVRAVVDRAGIEPAAVEDVIMGAAVQQSTTRRHGSTKRDTGRSTVNHALNRSTHSLAPLAIPLAQPRVGTVPDNPACRLQ